MDPIRILCATDNAYIPYYGIMLTSLFETNRAERFDVYVLTNGLNEGSVRLLQDLFSSYSNELFLVHIDDQMLADCPIRPGDHVSLATYYRLIAANVLPNNIEKILWLDGDLIINGPIRELWETDLGDLAIAAVPDESYCQQEIYQRLLLDASIPYTSAGVLLINLVHWRAHNIAARFMECIRLHRDRLLFHDQDTLNIVLQNEKAFLPLTWNFQSGFIASWVYPTYPESFQRQILQASANPRIIHYSGPSKPWFKHSLHPYRAHFEKYKALSPWNGLPLKRFGLKQDTRNHFSKFLRIIGLRPSPFILKDQSV